MIVLCIIFSALYLIINKKILFKHPFVTLFPLFSLILLIFIGNLSFTLSFVLFTSLSFAFNDLIERKIFFFPFVLLFYIVCYSFKIDYLLVICFTLSFLFFWLFCFLTKEKFIGLGDFYFIFPLSVYLFSTEIEPIPHFLFSNELFFNFCCFIVFIGLIIFFVFT